MPSRELVKTMREPSGDHAGSYELPPLTITLKLEPSAFMVAMSLDKRLKTILAPSGDQEPSYPTASAVYPVPSASMVPRAKAPVGAYLLISSFPLPPGKEASVGGGDGRTWNRSVAVTAMSNSPSPRRNAPRVIGLFPPAPPGCRRPRKISLFMFSLLYSLLTCGSFSPRDHLL